MKKPATGVIQIWLAGGPATIDMWDLKPDAPEEIRGEFRPIATAAPGVSICEHMPGLAKVMDRCTLVRSLGHTITAHGPGTTYMATGNRPRPALEYPAAGPLAARLLPPRQGRPALRHVRRAARRCLGHRPGYLGPAYGPFEVEGDPARGDAPGPRRVAPRGIHAARPASPARRFERPVRPRPAGARLRGGDGGPRPLPPPGRGDPPGPTASAPRSTSRASRTPCATTTAGRRWARGPSRRGG